MRDWHRGKVVLIWVGAVVLFFATRRTDAVIIGVLAPIIAATITWRWLSAREMPSLVLTKSSNDLPSQEDTGIVLTQEQLAAALYLFVRPFRERNVHDRAALAGLLAKSWGEVEWELFVLRRFAIEFAIRLAHSDDRKNPGALLRVFRAQFHQAALLDVSSPATLEQLSTSIDEYWNALPSDVDTLPLTVGTRFAHQLGSSDEAVIAAAASAFSTVFSAGRNTIAKLGSADKSWSGSHRSV